MGVTPTATVYCDEKREQEVMAKDTESIQIKTPFGEIPPKLVHESLQQNTSA